MNANIKAQLTLAAAARNPVKLRIGSIVEYKSMSGRAVQARVLCKTADGIDRYAVMPLDSHPKATNPVYVSGSGLTVLIR
jgi:hypothetical protein